jgi:hypothetical protein
VSVHSGDNQPERLADLPPIFRSTFTTKWISDPLQFNQIWKSTGESQAKSRLATTGATQALARNSHGWNLRSPKQARSAAPPNRTAGALDPMLPRTHVVDLPDPHVTGLPEPQTCSTAVRRISCTVVHQEPKNHGWSFISPALPFTGFDTAGA